MKHVTHWINGAPYVATESEVPADKVGAALTALRDKAVDLLDPERSGDIYDPATGKVSGTVDFASVRIMDEAVAAAKAAFAEWGTTSLTRRTQVMFSFRELLNERKEELAAIITEEHGKVLSDALGEVTRGLEVVEFACGIPHLLKGGYSVGCLEQRRRLLHAQAAGRGRDHLAVQLPGDGPDVVLPDRDRRGQHRGRQAQREGPELGATSSPSSGRRRACPTACSTSCTATRSPSTRCSTHPDVKAISFVGSTAIAKYVYETGTAHGKRVQALGGAKNHMVVLPDADLDLAADAAVNAGLRLRGGALHGDLRARRRRATAPTRSSPRSPSGWRPCAPATARRGCDMGPLVTGVHRDKVASYVDAGEAAGATLVVDGRDPVVDGDADGFWLGPTLFDNVTTDMSIYTDEIFGPVLSVVRVDSYEAALKLVNDHPYGNGTAIFTNDGGAARRYQNEVEVGMIGINVPIPVPMAYYSFGGWKSSLFGDTHAHGTEGVHFFTRGKVVTSRWLDPSHGGINLGFPTHG